jgi:uncharacterized protein DUF6875
MTARTTNLFLVEDLEDGARTGELAESDLAALRAVAGWIRDFVVRPHKDLGRPGPVCPFVPGSLERRTLHLAPERVADREVPELVELLSSYQRLLLEAPSADGDGVDHAVIVVVFTDLPADRAAALFEEVLRPLAGPSYEEDGIVFGPFYTGNADTAIHNPDFRPFQSPVPFVFVRHGVAGDWKFFLDKESWFDLWARRFGEAGTRALADELRHLQWRTASR